MVKVTDSLLTLFFSPPIYKTKSYFFLLILSYTYFACSGGSPTARHPPHPGNLANPKSSPFALPQMRKSVRGRGKVGKESGRPLTVMDPMQCSLIAPGLGRVESASPLQT